MATKVEKNTAEVWNLLVYKTVYLDMWLNNSKGSYYSFSPKLFLRIFSFSVHCNGKKYLNQISRFWIIKIYTWLRGGRRPKTKVKNLIEIEKRIMHSFCFLLIRNWPGKNTIKATATSKHSYAEDINTFKKVWNYNEDKNYSVWEKELLMINKIGWSDACKSN